MLNRIIAEGSSSENELKKYFEKLEDYDDPYFILIKTEKDIIQALPVIDKMVETGHEPYTYESFRLTEDLLFVCLDYSIDGVEAIIAEIMRILGTEGSLVHIAVFHHNCLGEGWETFDWTTRLLSEVILKSPADSAVEYNDFCDKENWPGIGKYMTCDNSGD